MLSEMNTFSNPQWLLLSLVTLPFLQGCLVLICKFLPKKNLGLLSSIVTCMHFTTVLLLSREVIDGETVQLSIDWFPKALVNFSLHADGLALFFSLLITGMGSLVFIYTQGYMNHKEDKIRYFYACLHFFVGSMLGAVLADNLIILFLFWEATSILSYLLISYDHQKEEARQSARSAFLLNAFASLALLLGFIMIGILDQTFTVSEIRELGILYGKHPNWILSILPLLLVGIYAKSAQFPFHFWLPNAMAAPTPVSAYLHSATMVKLGVYLTARIYILFIESEYWLPLVTTLSLISILVGGFYAFFTKKLKQVLAYATVSQLGFFISFYGLGDPTGLNYDYVHIFNHTLYKGSLFMLVGILAYSANATDIRQISGLIHRLPFTAIIFLISLAAMAGIPGTTGFISKELLITELISLAEKESSAGFIALGVSLGLLFKVAFTYRLFYYAFLRKTEQPIQVRRAPKLSLLVPPFILSTAALILGIWPQGLEIISKNFITPGLHASTNQNIQLWHGFSLTLGISVTIFIAGILHFYLNRSVEYFIKMERIPNLNRAWTSFLDNVPIFLEKVTRLFHSYSPEKHLLWLFSILSFIIGFILYIEAPSLPYWDYLDTNNITSILIILSTIILICLKRHLQQLILLSIVGFLVIFKFVLKQAPDLAMTQLIIEVATLFVIILLFRKIPPNEEKKVSSNKATTLWRVILSSLTGLTVATTPLFHAKISSDAKVGNFYIENAVPLAKGSNVVNTILVDFRALDTLGEIAVIVAATLGIGGLLIRRKTLNINYFSSLIPTPVLRFIMPSICVITFVLGFYLLLRGHNFPGGGFTGGLTPALSLILLTLSINVPHTTFFNKPNPFIIMKIGFAISLLSAILSMAMENKFFVAYFASHYPIFNTPLLFDTGIFLLVLGSVTAMVHSMRERTLWEKHK